MSGLLDGTRVLEVAGIGPVSFAGHLLAGLGCDVVRIARPPGVGVARTDGDPFAAGRESVAIDLRLEAGRSAFLALVAVSDVLIEGLRPGAMERLGVGPEECRATNDRLIYGRVSGFGRHGPWAARAGHDINFLALSGGLWSIGPADRPPTPPLNVVGDYGGGALAMVVGVLASLVERASSGQGAVVDTSILQGATSLFGLVFAGLARRGEPVGRPSALTLDILAGEAPFYRCYETLDGEFLAVGAVEPAFYDAFVRELGLASDTLPDRDDPANWAALRALFAERIAMHTRHDWADRFVSVDACVTPVLAPHEALVEPHNVANRLFEHADHEGRPRAIVDIVGTETMAPPTTVDVITRWSVDPTHREAVTPTPGVVLGRSGSGRP
ncbi:MAG: CaiB/BaiF CoA-transferase family protein [Ilumatobacteraceae bacterium]